MLASATVRWLCNAGVTCAFGADVFQRRLHQNARLLTVFVVVVFAVVSRRSDLQTVSEAIPFIGHLGCGADIREAHPVEHLIGVQTLG